MNNEASGTSQREKRHAALYFSPKNSDAYKELAARIRSDGGRTTLVWSRQWKGAESIMSEARAIVVEKGCQNADDIVEAYRRYAIDVEIHFADASGEFSEGESELTAPTAEELIEETEADIEARADAEAAESRAEIEAAGGETTETADPAILDPEDDGATIEEEHTDADAASDAAVQTEDGGDGEDPVDPNSDGDDAGTEDDGAEAGAEEPTDKS